MNFRDCDGCRFCCWSFNVSDVPVERRSLKVVELKRELTHCRHECQRGCDVHGTMFKPIICESFYCPYVSGVDIHRPDVFQPLLEELNGDMGNYIPAVSRAMDVEFAKDLIRETRSIPAAIMLEGQWVKLILPLDRQPDGSWVTTEHLHARWAVLAV